MSSPPPRRAARPSAARRAARIAAIAPALALLLTTAAPEATAQQRRAPRGRPPGRVIPRQFTPAVAIALGRALTRAETNSLDAAARRGLWNQSAVQFQRWTATAGYTRATTPAGFEKVRKKAINDLMRRVLKGRAVEPWKTVARLLPRILKRPMSPRMRRPARRATVPPTPIPYAGMGRGAAMSRPRKSPAPRSQPRRAQPRATSAPRQLIGKWSIGSPSLQNLYNPRTGVWRSGGGKGTLIIFYPDGRYIRVMTTQLAVTMGSSGGSRTYTQGRYQVRGQQLVFRPRKISGYSQFLGGKRTPIKGNYKPQVSPWAIRVHNGAEYLHLGRRLQLRRMSRRP